LVFTFIFVCVENCVCLSHNVQVTCATWRGAIRIVAGVGDLVQRTGDGRTGRVFGSRTVEWWGDAVCDLHRLKTKVNSLLVV
jgi:hypothetical protein